MQISQKLLKKWPHSSNNWQRHKKFLPRVKQSYTNILIYYSFVFRKNNKQQQQNILFRKEFRYIQLSRSYFSINIYCILIVFIPNKITNAYFAYPLPFVYLENKIKQIYIIQFYQILFVQIHLKKTVKNCSNEFKCKTNVRF